MYPGYDPEFLPRLFNLVKYPSSITPTQVVYEMLVYILAAVLIYHGFKKFGRWKTLLFFFGSFLYTGFEENIMIISGRVIPDIITEFPQTYAFNYENYVLWILAVPFVVFVAWFVVAYSAVHIAFYIFKTGIWRQAALGGLLAMEMDLLIDPVAVRYAWWGWFPAANQAIWIFGIPISNFMGWFALIFFFAIYWKKLTDREEKWGIRKCTIVFSLGLIPLLFGTVFLLGGLTIALTPFNGFSIPLPFGGT
ncbi:MAG: carotenoid biosynthesis protein [Candidatus Helarchaeota archaeon]|nr:carotenoid biosynthesis protein [Candidatus Helarchaeota archaeon]